MLAACRRCQLRVCDPGGKSPPLGGHPGGVPPLSIRACDPGGKPPPLGVTRAACRRCQFEPVTLVVNHHLWGSPDSIQGGGRMRMLHVCVGRGHAPAAPVRLQKQLTGSTAPTWLFPKGEARAAYERQARFCAIVHPTARHLPRLGEGGVRYVSLTDPGRSRSTARGS